MKKQSEDKTDFGIGDIAKTSPICAIFRTKHPVERVRIIQVTGTGKYTMYRAAYLSDGAEATFCEGELLPVRGGKAKVRIEETWKQVKHLRVVK